MTAGELLLIIASVFVGTLPLGVMVGTLQSKVRRLQEENVRLWRGLFGLTDQPYGLLAKAEGAAPRAGGAAPDIDNPSERREAT